MNVHTSQQDGDQPKGFADVGAPVLARYPSFDYLNLALLDAGSAATVLKSQHAQLLSIFDDIERSLGERSGESENKFLKARNLLTTLAMMLTAHFSMEENVLLKQLNGDPKTRLLATQFERDCGNLKAAFSEFNKRFPAPTTIRNDPQSFVDGLNKLRRTFTDGFRGEERDIYAETDVPAHP